MKIYLVEITNLINSIQFAKRYDNAFKNLVSISPYPPDIRDILLTIDLNIIQTVIPTVNCPSTYEPGKARFPILKPVHSVSSVSVPLPTQVSQPQSKRISTAEKVVSPYAHLPPPPKSYFPLQRFLPNQPQLPPPPPPQFQQLPPPQLQQLPPPQLQQHKWVSNPIYYPKVPTNPIWVDNPYYQPRQKSPLIDFDFPVSPARKSPQQYPNLL